MSSTRDICAALSAAFIGAGIYAVNGAINSGVGSSVLRAVGYAGYSMPMLGAANAAAAGGAVVGAVAGLVSGSFFNSGNANGARSFEEIANRTITAVTINAGLSAAGGALGSVMLNAIAEVPLAKIAAATAVGAGVTGGAAAVLVLGCMGLIYHLHAAAPVPAPIDLPVVAPGGPRMV